MWDSLIQILLRSWMNKQFERREKLWTSPFLCFLYKYPRWHCDTTPKRSRDPDYRDITTDPIRLTTSLCLLDDDLSQPLVKINFLFKTENVWELKATSNTEYKSVVNYLKPKTLGLLRARRCCWKVNKERVCFHNKILFSSSGVLFIFTSGQAFVNFRRFTTARLGHTSALQCSKGTEICLHHTTLRKIIKVAEEV